MPLYIKLVKTFDTGFDVEVEREVPPALGSFDMSEINAFEILTDILAAGPVTGATLKIRFGEKGINEAETNESPILDVDPGTPERHEFLFANATTIKGKFPKRLNFWRFIIDEGDAMTGDQFCLDQFTGIFVE
jgi:hypothetical protein